MQAACSMTSTESNSIFYSFETSLEMGRATLKGLSAEGPIHVLLAIKEYGKFLLFLRNKAASNQAHIFLNYFAA